MIDCLIAHDTQDNPKPKLIEGKGDVREMAVSSLSYRPRFKPSEHREAVALVRALNQKLGYLRTARVLGVNHRVMGQWLTYQRQPSAAARTAVKLVHSLVFDPGSLVDFATRQTPTCGRKYPTRSTQAACGVGKKAQEGKPLTGKAAP